MATPAFDTSAGALFALPARRQVHLPPVPLRGQSYGSFGAHCSSLQHSALRTVCLGHTRHSTVSIPPQHYGVAAQPVQTGPRGAGDVRDAGSRACRQTQLRTTQVVAMQLSCLYTYKFSVCVCVCVCVTCRLIIFLAVYNGIVTNQNLPRFVRFNAMQAVLLDVLLM